MVIDFIPWCHGNNPKMIYIMRCTHLFMENNPDIINNYGIQHRHRLYKSAYSIHKQPESCDVNQYKSIKKKI